MSDPTVDPRAVTPVYGWHVPVLGDVPNVPADISALATGIEATMRGVVEATFGIIQYLSATVANGTRLTTVYGSSARGSISTDGAGRLTITKTGLYWVTAQITSQTASSPWMQATVRDDASTRIFKGTISPGTGVGGSSTVTVPLAVTAGVPVSVGLWMDAAASQGVVQPHTYLFIARIGDITP